MTLANQLLDEPTLRIFGKDKLLARKAKAVGRKAPLNLEIIVSPDTLQRWHRRLAAENWRYPHWCGAGWPGIVCKIAGREF